MRTMTIAFGLLVSACAAGGHDTYRDAAGKGRGDEALRQDLAACQYDAQSKGLGPRFVHLCMRSFGWEYAGRQR